MIPFSWSILAQSECLVTSWTAQNSIKGTCKLKKVGHPSSASVKEAIYGKRQQSTWKDLQIQRPTRLWREDGMSFHSSWMPSWLPSLMFVSFPGWTPCPWLVGKTCDLRVCVCVFGKVYDIKVSLSEFLCFIHTKCFQAYWPYFFILNEMGFTLLNGFPMCRM